MIPQGWSDHKLTTELTTSTWTSLWIGAAGFLILVPISYVFRYRRSIRRRLKEIEDGFSQGIMVRETKDASSSAGGTKQKRKEIRCLELNPEFVEKHNNHWKLVSLGKYLTSLQPCLPGSSTNTNNDSGGEGEDATRNSMLPKFIERELETTIGAVLLRALGRRFGGAILPLLGITDVQSRTASIATSIASWWVSHFMVTGKLGELGDEASVIDAGSLPFNLNEVFAMANINEKFISSTMEVKSLELMRRGEVGYEPSLARPLPEETGVGSDEKEVSSKNESAEVPELVPNPFIISIHWNSAIEGLEKVLMSKTTVTAPDAPNAEAKESSGNNYDPGDRSLPVPTPINPRLLPDLYLGWGSAECTHTKREIIRNRLLGVLVNKLSYNFYQKEQNQSNLFHQH